VEAAALSNLTITVVLAHRSRKASRARRPAAGRAPGLGASRQGLTERAIACLPETYRQVFVLVDVEGLSLAATAQILGLGVAAARSRLVRARLLVNDGLAAYRQSV
jgi:DNA-directed RNA polymerase specialized sigma24 family protein